MSMRSYFVNGIGFSVECIDIANTLRFIRKHGATLLKEASHDDSVYASISEFLYVLHKEIIPDEDYVISDDMMDALDSVSEFDDAYAGLDLVEEIINAETDFGVCFEQGQAEDACIGGACIILPARYPWEYSESFKKMDRGELVSALREYAEELGLDTEIEELEVEYFG